MGISTSLHTSNIRLITKFDIRSDAHNANYGQMQTIS